MHKQISILFIILSALLITGCASSLQGDTYSRDDARQIQNVQYGTIENIRLVVIEGTKTPIGSATGAIIGGIAGNTIGDGRGAAIATVLGAVAGGLAGSAAEESLTKSQGIELVVRLLDSNKTIAVVQQHNPDENFHIGDKVRLTSINGQVRVAL
ncbi:MAG: glycine zipper 2TM domain-containing protein [Piscirickettsiaceae bacterium]|nr:glycine zipper 2TM domain-containing protein [Piscirickettsiaceae bacterium]